MLTKILELCREGIHGTQGTVVNRKSILELSENYIPDSAPVTTWSHDKAEYAPALGTVKNVWTAPSSKDNSKLALYGKVIFNDIIEDSIKKNHFPSWSIGGGKSYEDGKYYLHHLKMCGSVPGAVKGLSGLPLPEGLMLSDFKNIETFDFTDEADPDEEDESLETEEAEEIKKLKEENKKLKKIISDLQEKYPDEEIELSDFPLSDRAKKQFERIKQAQRKELKKAMANKYPPGAKSFVLQLADSLSGVRQIMLCDSPFKIGKEPMNIYEALTKVFEKMPNFYLRLQDEIIHSDEQEEKTYSFSNLRNKG